MTGSKSFRSTFGVTWHRYHDDPTAEEPARCAPPQSDLKCNQASAKHQTGAAENTFRHGAHRRLHSCSICTVSARLLLSGLILIVTPSAQNDAFAVEVGTADASEPLADDITTAAQRFAIPELWIRAVMQIESAGDVHAVSPKGAMGLMQIMPDTWAELRDRLVLGDDPFNARDNIMAGTAYLRMMHDRFGSPGFLAAYNAGPARFEQFLFEGRPLPAETIDYVARLAPMIGIEAHSIADSWHRQNRDWREAELFVQPLDGEPIIMPWTSDRQITHQTRAYQPSIQPLPNRQTNGVFVNGHHNDRDR